MSTCPGCGAEVEYAVQEARVLTGTCPDCHRVTTLVEGTLPLGTADPSTAPEAAPAAASPTTGPECADCGGILAVTAGDDGTLEVTCAECETTTTFVPQGSPPPRSPAPDRYERPRRREMPGGEGPRSRPCRQCGAPLTFTTDENGNLTGECASCGNRFTLPPRRDGPPGRDRGSGGRFGDRGPPRYGRDSRGFSGAGRGGRPRYGGSGGGYRRRDSDSEGSDGGDDRRRRRPRRE